MIISKTPFRISFFGGGTDYPSWYRENGGAVLATSINKYCYLTCRSLPPLFDYKYRLVYTNIEEANQINSIKHPAAREVLKYLNWEENLEIHYNGELPARSGLGTSASFTVGLLHALSILGGRKTSQAELAHDAIYVEQKMIQEAVGSQDQMATALGGLNMIRFGVGDRIEVRPLSIDSGRQTYFEKNLLLFYTGFVRNSFEIAKNIINNIPFKDKELRQLKELAPEGESILTGTGELDSFGKLLHENWQIKRSLAKRITNNFLDDIYNNAIDAGALGGKVLGAGGGGFFLFYVKEENQKNVINRLNKLTCVPFGLENKGTHIIHETYSESEQEQYVFA